MKFRATNKKTKEKLYFDESDMHNPVVQPTWQDTAIWVIDDPDDPDSRNKIMLLARDYDIENYHQGEWFPYV